MDSFQFSPEYEIESQQSFMVRRSQTYVSSTPYTSAPQEESLEPASQNPSQPLSPLEKRMLDFASAVEALGTNAERGVLQDLHQQRIEILRHRSSNSETTSTIQESVALRFKSANRCFWDNYRDVLGIHF